MEAASPQPPGPLRKKKKPPPRQQTLFLFVFIRTAFTAPQRHAHRRQDRDACRRQREQGLRHQGRHRRGVGDAARPAGRLPVGADVGGDLSAGGAARRDAGPSGRLEQARDLRSDCGQPAPGRRSDSLHGRRRARPAGADACWPGDGAVRRRRRGPHPRALGRPAPRRRRCRPGVDRNDPEGAGSLGVDRRHLPGGSAGLGTMSSYAPLLAGLVALLAGLTIGKAWERYKLQDGRWIDRRRARESPHYILGLNFLVANQIDLAIEELSRAASLDSEGLEVHMILGNLYREKGQVGKAITVHQSLLQRSRLSRLEHAYVLLCIGLDYKRGGFVDRALEAFNEVLRLEPKNEYALVNLQKLHEEQHQWTEAYDTRERLNKLSATESRPQSEADRKS